MRIFVTLLALVTVSIAQYLPVDNVNQVERFDCSLRSDGSYAVRECSETYVQCVAGLLYSEQCPEGLVYLASQDRCLHVSDCSKNEPTETAGKATTAGTLAPLVPVPTQASSASDSAVFDCSWRQDGEYSVGCVNEYVQCTNGRVVMRSCPESLVFDNAAGQCRYQCSGNEITTVASTTSLPITVSQRKCVGLEVATYGECSSKFKRCRNGIWIGALCPGATVFDATIGLCVYDLPVCKTDIFNPAYPTNSPIDMSSPSYNTIEQFDLPYNGQTNIAPYTEGQLASQYTSDGSNFVSNPFFVLRHKNRRSRKHHDKRDYKDRSNTGKLRYSSRSTRIDHNVHRVDDGLDGKAEHHIQQNYRPTFPRSYKRKNADWKNVWEATDDDSNEKKLDVPLRVTDGESKPIVEELNHLDLEEGSGDGDFPIGLDEINRKRRSSSFGPYVSQDVSLCSNQLDGAFLSMGSCRQDFIVCSKSGAQIRAACAVGDLFDKDAKLCVSEANCEKKPYDDSVAFESVNVTLANFYPVDKFSVVDPCEGRANGPLALGCSVSYKMCDNNVGHEMACPGGLVFDEGRNICDYQENVAICGGHNVEDSRPIFLPYSSAVSDRRPLEISSSTVSSLSAVPRLISLSSAYHPVLSTPRTPYYVASAPSPSVASNEGQSNDVCARLPAGYHQSQLCSSSFVHCSDAYREAVLMTCSTNLVFSSETNQCQEKEKVRGCAEYVNFASANEPIRLPIHEFDSVHKEHVFTTDLHSSSPVLATTQTSVNVYASTVANLQVPEESLPSAVQVPKMNSECRGLAHGAHLADEKDCTSFYRCVWNRLEKMRCPGGTVFNPNLSVCDVVSNVPSCKNNAPFSNSYY